MIRRILQRCFGLGKWDSLEWKYRVQGIAVVSPILLALIVLLIALAMQGGCASANPFRGLANPAVPGAAAGTLTGGDKVIADFSGTLGFIASFGLLAGVGLLAASFFVPLIPRKVAGLALGIAALAFVARYVIVVWGAVSITIAFWLTVAVGGVVLVTTVWPLVLAWKNRNLAKIGKQLETQHPEAAVALQAAARGMTGEKDKAARRDMLQLVKVRAASIEAGGGG